MNTKIRSLSLKAMTALALLQSSPLVASNVADTLTEDAPLLTNNLDTMPSEILGRISVYLPLSDLQSFEQVCTKTAKDLRDASLYNALTLDHSLKDSTGSELPSKDKFLDLLNTGNGDFILTLAKFMLDQNIFDGEQYQAFDFPFKSKKYRPKIKPFRKLSASLKSLGYGFNALPPVKRAQALFYKALITLKIKAKPQALLRAFDRFDIILDNPAVPDDLAVKIEYYMSVIELQIEDFGAARKGFDALITDPATPADVKAKAHYFLAQMHLRGQGGAQDFVAARAGFEAVLNAPATPADAKTMALFHFAEMDLFGQGGLQDFGSARTGFDAVVTNPSAPADLKAKAQYYLAEMNSLGRGGPQDFVNARTGFMAVLNDPAAPDYLKRSALSSLDATDFFRQMIGSQNSLAIQGQTDLELKDAENKRVYDDSEDENSDTPPQKKARRERKG